MSTPTEQALASLLKVAMPYIRELVRQELATLDARLKAVERQVSSRHQRPYRRGAGER